MLIGELSNKSGFTRDTIRFYEKKGLISIKRNIRRENNYIEYSDENLDQLLIIKKIKRFGFTLNETSELLELVKLNKASCSSLAHKINNKVSVINEKIKELVELKLMMEGLLKDENTCCPSENIDGNCPILVPDLQTPNRK